MIKKVSAEILVISVLLLISGLLKAQEIWFFREGTDNTFYDQGLVNVNSMGSSTFEYTHPPGLPQFNDKVPCSTTAYRGNTSLKFSYTSSENGNWHAVIYRNDWSSADISQLDSLSFFVFTESELTGSELPLIGLIAAKINSNNDIETNLFSPEEFIGDIPAGQWIKISLPLKSVFENSNNTNADFSRVKAVVFNQSEKNGSSRVLLIDDIVFYKGLTEIPPPENFSAEGFDSHTELNWKFPVKGIFYRIYASFDNGNNFELRAETDQNFYLDFIPEHARNKNIIYRLVSVSNEMESEPVEINVQTNDFSDEELIDMFQRYAFRYFWEGAHQNTGMISERSNGDDKIVASGATGMGLMAMIVAGERGYRPSEEIKNRVLSILGFLENCERHHGAWSHWYDANTYQTQPFSTYDDGGDIVETSFVAVALIALRNYYTGSDSKSVQIREKAGRLWREIDWNWYRNGNQNVLYWHWSPNYNFQMNLKVTGWNESLVTYIMAASSPENQIPEAVYHQGWTRNGSMVNPRTFYGYPVRLSPDWGGPLFWIHYTHLGINPHSLSDNYADYWEECVNTVKVHIEYAVENPKGHANYSEKNWGLTASDDPYGYTAHAPFVNDNGTISPTAALSSMPYTPAESIKALKYFYRERGNELFGKYGPYDAFNDNLGWIQKSYIGINQAPIVIMLENYRTGLLWDIVMKDHDLQAGLQKLGFTYLVSAVSEKLKDSSGFKIYPNPAVEQITISLDREITDNSFLLQICSVDGRIITEKKVNTGGGKYSCDISKLNSGIYIAKIVTRENSYSSTFIINKQ